jgi:hypothetical protein
MISADLPSLLQSFFTDRLLRQRQASPHTIAGYRDCFRLLLHFAKERLGKMPSKLGYANAMVYPITRSFPASAEVG